MHDEDRQWNEHRRVTPEQLINLTYMNVHLLKMILLTCHRDKFQHLQEKKAEEAQASQVLIDRLQRQVQVQETKELLEKERSTNAASLTRLENTLIAMVRDNFSTQMKVFNAQH